MTNTAAIDLIKLLQLRSGSPQFWADLGSGSGVFSRALASLLPRQSHILCVDKTDQDFSLVEVNGVQLEFKKADFVNDAFEGMEFDGLLMANSLHYVRDKEGLIDKLSGLLKAGGIFLVIEYDTVKPNPWVPYPIDFKSLQKLFENRGYRRITRLGESKSIYGKRKIYACSIAP